MNLQCSGGFFANSDITLYPIPKQEFLEQYDKSVSLSASQDSVPSSQTCEGVDEVAPFQYEIGLLKSSNRKILSKKDLPPLTVDETIIEDDKELKEFLKTTWSAYPLQQEWIGFPKPDIEKIKAHESEYVYYVVDGVHRWISWYIYNFVMKASGLQACNTIHSKILQSGLTNRVLTLISSSINNAQETTVKMNVISLARYVSTMCKSGYTVDGLEEHITQLEGKSAASISQFKQIGDRFEKLGLLDRLQDLADSLPNDTYYLYPFKTNFILTGIMPNAKSKPNAIACLDYVERMALQRKKQVDEWKLKFDNATTEAEKKGVEKPQKGKSIGNILTTLKSIPGRVAAVNESVKLCESREKEAIKLLKAKVGDEDVVSEEKIKLVKEQTRHLKDEFLDNFKSGKFDNVVPEALKVTLKKKIPLSTQLVPQEDDEKSDSVSDFEKEVEESAAKKDIRFDLGDSLTCFYDKFKKFSPTKQAQLCLTDPPWGLLQAAKHQHDVEWTKNQWHQFALQITKSMVDDGVILVFTPHFLLARVTSCFAKVGWDGFRNPLYWVFKSKFFSYSHQPCNTVQPILAFCKSGKGKTFKVNINTNSKLEQTWAKRKHNPFLNVFQCRGPSTYRKKPSKRKSKGQLEPDDEDDPDTVASQLYDSGVFENAENVHEAKNRLQRFRVEEKPVLLLRLLIQRYAPGADDIVIDPCYGTGSTGVAAFLENKSFYGMDEDTLASVVADRYLKVFVNKAKAKSAGKAYVLSEAVEAGVKSTHYSSLSDDDQHGEGSDTQDSGSNDGGKPEPEDRGSPEPECKWYFGDDLNDEGKHVLTLFYQKQNKCWKYENAPVVLQNVDLFKGPWNQFVMSLSLASDMNSQITLSLDNWDPPTENEFKNDNPLALMVSLKLNLLNTMRPTDEVDIEDFTMQFNKSIDDFNKVVETAIDTPIHSYCSGGCQGGCFEDQTLEKTIDRRRKGSG